MYVAMVDKHRLAKEREDIVMNTDGDGAVDSVDADNVLAWGNVDYSGKKDTSPRSPHLDVNNTVGMNVELTGQTTFDPSDVDGGNWEWLAELNRGRGESEQRSRRHKAGVQRDAIMVASRLNGTEYHADRAQWLLRQLDLKEQLLQRGDVESMVMGVVTMVIDEDRTRMARRHGSGTVKSVLRENAFNELCKELDVTRRDVHTVRKRLADCDVYVSPNETV